jgi:hypothetical protein
LPRLLELAGHCHFSPRPCRPGRGNEKGRVERRIRDLRTSFFAGRRFTDLDDLRRQFLRWQAEIAYARPCPADAELTVEQAWQREQPLLLPLPEHDIDTDDVRPTVARKQPYVIYDTNRYSIPHDRVGTPLTIAASDQQIRVLQGSEVVAVHPRCWDRRQVIEQPAHLERLLQAKRTGRAAAGRSRLLDVVPEAEALYVELVTRGEPLGPNTAHLLRLLDRHGPQALREAVAEALRRGTPRAASVEHVLGLLERSRGQRPTLPLHLTQRPDLSNLKTRNHRLEDYDAIGRIPDHEPRR